MNSEKKLHILLADDHTLILEGLKSLIGAQPDMDVVGHAENGEEAAKLAIRLQPDVVVMDISMPKMSGLEATSLIKDKCPGIKVLVLSMHEDATFLRGALDAGASGYVLKRTAPQELVQAIRYVAAEGAYLDPVMAAKVIDAFKSSANRREGSSAVLSERETEVIQQVAMGLTNREIAEKADLSIKTVETYRARAMEKLGLSNRAQLVRHAAANGWLTER